jgi:hypothetical protein
VLAHGTYPPAEEARVERITATIYGVLHVRPWPWDFHTLSQLIHTTGPQVGVVTLMLLMRKLMVYRVKSFAQGYIGI